MLFELAVHVKQDELLLESGINGYKIILIEYQNKLNLLILNS